MATSSVRVNSGFTSGPDWSSVGTSSPSGALSDSSDSTYLRAYVSGNGLASRQIPPANLSLPSNAKIKQVRVRYRYQVMASSNWNFEHVYYLDGTRQFRTNQAILTSDTQTVTGTWHPEKPGGGNWTLADFHDFAWEVQIYNEATTTREFRLYAVWFDIEYNLAPTVTIESPTSGEVISNTSAPTVVLEYDDPENDPMEAREWYLFDATRDELVQEITKEFTRSNRINLPALSPGSYELGLRVFQSWPNTDHASSYVNRNFSIDLPVPGIPSLSTNPEHDLSRIGLQIIDPIQEEVAQEFEIQKRVGDDWVPLSDIAGTIIANVLDNPIFQASDPWDSWTPYGSSDTGVQTGGTIGYIVRLTSSGGSLTGVQQTFDHEFQGGDKVRVRARVQTDSGVQQMAIWGRDAEGDSTLLSQVVAVPANEWTVIDHTLEVPSGRVLSQIRIGQHNPTSGHQIRFDWVTVGEDNPYDFEAAPGKQQRYRVRGIAYDSSTGFKLAGSWSTQRIATLNPEFWWLKAPSDPTKNMRVRRVNQVQVKTKDTRSTAHYALDRDDAIVVSNRVTKSQFPFSFLCTSEEDYESLVDLLSSGQKLLLTSPRAQWYVRVIGDISEEMDIRNDPGFYATLNAQFAEVRA